MAMPSWTKDFTRELMSGSLEEVAAKIKTAVASSDLPATALRGMDRVLSEVKKNASHVRRWAQRNASLDHSTLNASGSFFAPDLGGAPQTDDQWQAAFVGCDVYASNLDVQRDRILRQLQSTISQFTGQHCLVARSSSAAIAAVGVSIGDSQTVLVPRRLDYRPDYRGPVQDYFSATQTQVCEVGTASGYCDDDWARALQNCRGDALALELNLPASHIQPSSRLPESLQRPACKRIQIVPYGCFRTPCDVLSHAASIVNAESVKGTWLTVLPTDLMIGGPRGALILGSEEALANVASCSLWTALEASLGTIAAITQTVQQPSTQTLWLAKLADASIENLQSRAERLATQLACVDTIASCEIDSRPAVVDEFLNLEVPSRQLLLRSTGKSPENWADDLKSDSPALLVSTDDDHLIVDLRWLPAKHDGLVANLLSGQLAGIHTGDASE